MKAYLFRLILFWSLLGVSQTLFFSSYAYSEEIQVETRLKGQNFQSSNVYKLARSHISKTTFQSEIFQAQLTRVVDGDTLIVNNDDHLNLKIRLYGVDAPEKDQPGGHESGEFLKSFLYQLVDVEILDVDRYQRAVAVVYFEDVSLNARLVQNGWAWFYPQYCRRQPLCSDLQQEEVLAKKERLGLWRELAPRPPWIWRKKTKTGDK